MYICIYIYVCMYVCMNVCMYVYMYMYMYMYLCISINKFILVCKYRYVNVYLYMCINGCIYFCIYVWIHVSLTDVSDGGGDCDGCQSTVSIKHLLSYGFQTGGENDLGERWTEGEGVQSYCIYICK